MQSSAINNDLSNSINLQKETNEKVIKFKTEVDTMNKIKMKGLDIKPNQNNNPINNFLYFKNKNKYNK